MKFRYSLRFGTVLVEVNFAFEGRVKVEYGDESALPYLVKYLHYRLKDAFRVALIESISLDESMLLEPESNMAFYESVTSQLDEEDILRVIDQSFNERQVQAKKIFKLRLDSYSVEETAKELFTAFVVFFLGSACYAVAVIAINYSIINRSITTRPPSFFRTSIGVDALGFNAVALNS